MRTTYEPVTKKPRAEVVGRLALSEPEVSPELEALLSPAERDEVRAWLATQHRAVLVKEEHAALTLADTMAQAERWFSRNEDPLLASTSAAQILQQWAALKRTLKNRELFE